MNKPVRPVFIFLLIFSLIILLAFFLNLDLDKIDRKVNGASDIESETKLTISQIDSLFTKAVIERLISLFEEYGQQCWEDSFYVDHTSVYLEGDSIWVSEKWVHKTPKFLEFMDFVKGKGKTSQIDSVKTYPSSGTSFGGYIYIY